MSRRTKIFLSYARRDGSELVQRVRGFLRPGGADAWVDVHDIQAGEDWREALDLRVRESDAMVLILTPAAVASAEVRKEVEAAEKYQKTIIPLLFEGAKAPDWLGRTQYIEFTRLEDPAALGKLTGDVSKVWDAIESELQAARLRVRDELLPLIDLLQQTILAAVPRPPVHPEVLRACIEVADRMSAEDEPRPLGALIAEWRIGTFVTDAWRTFRTHQNEKRVIAKILEQVFKNVKVPKVQTVPFVLVVMTDREAVDLETGQALAGASPGFDALLRQTQARLTAAGVTDWARRYGPTPEAWHPFGRDEPSLARLINAGLETWRPIDKADVLRPQFIDVRTINSDREQLARLRAEGCVVMVDPVSICHPTLLTEYRRTMLDLFPTTLLLNVGAYNPKEMGAHTVTLPFVQRADSFFFERMTMDEDERCDVAIADYELRKFIREKVFGLFLQDPEGIRSFRHTRP